MVIEMKHTPQGTTIEKGDPCHISFHLGNCPVCGRKLADDPKNLWKTGGHLKSILFDKDNILFSACAEHFEEAQKIPTRMTHKQSPGYKGQWEPRFGLMAQVCRSGEPDTYVRLV
jgi:hypothetical protein